MSNSVSKSYVHVLKDYKRKRNILTFFYPCQNDPALTGSSSTTAAKSFDTASDHITVSSVSGHITVSSCFRLNHRLFLFRQHRHRFRVLLFKKVAECQIDEQQNVDFKDNEIKSSTI
jgi:hypothetical protein